MAMSFRVFCGFDARQAEAAEVFAYSVRENTTVDVDVRFVSGNPADGERHDVSGWSSFNRVGVTSFSYARFLVPSLMGFSGRAAFFDAADQLCLGDVAELADFDMQGKPVCVVKHPPIRPGMKRARSWSSAMLMDCAQFRWLTPSFVETATDVDLMLFARLADDEIGELPPEWNVLIERGSPPYIDVSIPTDKKRVLIPGLADFGDVPPGTKLVHWSALSNPNMGNWIEKSGSAVWARWRQEWLASQSQKT